MAKIVRKLQKIFGINAGLNQRGKIGSIAAGTPEYATDPDDIQDLANYESGLYSLVVGNNSPAIQDINSLYFLITRQIAYLFQQGISEWNSETEYHLGSMVNNDGQIYISRTNDNLNNVLSDGTNWSLFYQPAFYFGPSEVDGTFRIIQDGTDLKIQVRTGGNYVDKDIINA